MCCVFAASTGPGKNTDFGDRSIRTTVVIANLDREQLVEHRDWDVTQNISRRVGTSHYSYEKKWKANLTTYQMYSINYSQQGIFPLTSPQTESNRRVQTRKLRTG